MKKVAQHYNYMQSSVKKNKEDFTKLVYIFLISIYYIIQSMNWESFQNQSSDQLQHSQFDLHIFYECQVCHKKYSSQALLQNHQKTKNHRKCNEKIEKESGEEKYLQKDQKPKKVKKFGRPVKQYDVSQNTVTKHRLQDNLMTLLGSIKKHKKNTIYSDNIENSSQNLQEAINLSVDHIDQSTKKNLISLNEFIIKHELPLIYDPAEVKLDHLVDSYKFLQLVDYCMLKNWEIVKTLINSTKVQGIYYIFLIWCSKNFQKIVLSQFINLFAQKIQRPAEKNQKFVSFQDISQQLFKILDQLSQCFGLENQPS